MERVVLVREPWSQWLVRLAARGWIPALAATAWWLDAERWMVIVLTVAAALPAMLFAFTVVNIAKNQGALLVKDTDNSLYWPRSIQEVLLRRPPERVRGPHFTVIEHPPVFAPNRQDPRISVVDDESAIHRVPTFGASVDATVADLAAELRPYGLTVKLNEPEPPEPDPPPEDNANPYGLEWPD